MTKDEALDLALYALKELVAQTEARLFAVKHDHVALQNAREAITAIKQARSAPVQEPVVWVRTNGLNNSGVAHYGPTRPPGWVGAATAYFKAPPPEPAQKRMHPELKKLYEDFFDKCFKETVDLALYPTPPAAQPAPVQERCESCDGTGDVHDQTGEWRGTCHCVKAAQRQWAGLTDEEIDNAWLLNGGGLAANRFHDFARAIETKLKEKNNG
jgi:hypothetical protein